MGCPCSKQLLEQLDKHQQQQEGDDHAEAVLRCKQRKELAKHAHEARSAFSRAHAAYLRALASVGDSIHALDLHQQQGKGRRAMALQYTPAEADRVVLRPPVLCRPRSEGRNRPPPPVLLPSDVHNWPPLPSGTIIRPPPPPPVLLPSDVTPSPLPFETFDPFTSSIFVPEELEDEEEEENKSSSGTGTRRLEEESEDQEEMVFEIQEGGNVKVKESIVHHQEHQRADDVLKSALKSGSSGGGDDHHHKQEEEKEENILAIVKTRSFVPVGEILRAVSNDFRCAAASGAVVARMLEAGKGLKNTTGLGLLGEPSRLKAQHESELDELVGDDISWSHAITLERLCAWELKLYEEVKAVHSMNIEFNKKRKLLSKLNTYGKIEDEDIECTRAEIKAIETQMSVAIQAMEATAAAIQKIINEELHYQLVELLGGLTETWKQMHECHEHQRRMVLDLRFPDDDGAALEPAGTSTIQGDLTHKLELAVSAWQGSLEAVISREEDFIRSLTGWLAASIPKDNRKQHITRRQARLIRLALPEIFFLCQEWERAVSELPKDTACGSIWKFAQLVRRIREQQAEELKVHRRLEGLSREVNSRASSMNSTEKKVAKMGSLLTQVLPEKRSASEQMEDEKTKLKQATEAPRQLVSTSVPAALQSLFQGVSEFSASCLDKHQQLHINAKQGIKPKVVN